MSEHKRKSNGRKWRVRGGLHAPGVYAAHIAKSIENGDRRKDILRGVRRLQDEMMFVDCSSCGTRYHSRIIPETQARRFYYRALHVQYAEFLEEVEYYFDRLEDSCPHCGRTGRLSVPCPGDDDDVLVEGHDAE